MKMRELLEIKRELFACAPDCLETRKRLNQWLMDNVMEFGHSESYGPESMVRFKSVVEFTNFRESNVRKMHLEIVSSIADQGLSVVESQEVDGPVPKSLGGKPNIEDRVRIYVLGRMS